MKGPDRHLDRVLVSLREAVTRGGDVEATVGRVKEVLSSALKVKGWLPERCRRPEPKCYARHLIHSDPQGLFILVAMVWQPGQKTPIHDHGGIWCVEGVYEGRIRVRRYALEQMVSESIARFHESEVLDSSVGSTGMLIPPVEHHVMENDHDEVAISIHAYGHDLQSCHVYMPRADGAYDVLVKQLRYISTPGAHPARELVRG